MILKISQAKLAMINDKQYDLLKLLQTPFFYARTPKMTLLLSLLSDPSIIDRKNHTVLESCIKLVLFLPTIPTCIKSWMNLRHNPSCAEALLSSGVSTNNKELCEKSFLLVYNLM